MYLRPNQGFTKCFINTVKSHFTFFFFLSVISLVMHIYYQCIHFFTWQWNILISNIKVELFFILFQNMNNNMLILRKRAAWTVLPGQGVSLLELSKSWENERKLIHVQASHWNTNVIAWTIFLENVQGERIKMSP